ncbi:MAG: nucleotidyltransferase substrate binding protein [Taibaiella sp.]|nr:nucleotidyltransferase substrate binding protein [Taibaiella sp.]
MDAPSARWRQRYLNFSKAVENLRTAIAIPEPTEVERAGIVHYFELAFELAWKTLKDYLNEKGYIIASPKEVIKQAFNDHILPDGHIWLQMLDSRNLIAHTYDEEHAAEVLHNIRTAYAEQIILLHQWLSDK